MIEIKQAFPDDFETISRLAYEIWPSAYGEILSKDQLGYMLNLVYSHASLLHQYDTLGHQFIIVTDDNIPVGFASFSPHEDLAVYHLNKIYVLPNQQGKSVGKKMLQYIINEIKKSGATSLQLNVNRHNKALHFYEKMGFTIIRKEDIDIGNGYFMNDYVMEMKL